MVKSIASETYVELTKIMLALPFVGNTGVKSGKDSGYFKGGARCIRDKTRKRACDCLIKLP